MAAGGKVVPEESLEEADERTGEKRCSPSLAWQWDEVWKRKDLGYFTITLEDMTNGGKVFSDRGHWYCSAEQVRMAASDKCQDCRVKNSGSKFVHYCKEVCGFD